jgi:hypothetical protein
LRSVWQGIHIWLAEIQKEFDEKLAQKWFAADISEGKKVLIDKFDPNAKILLIPQVSGGGK